MTSLNIEGRMRQALLLLASLIFPGTIVELILEDHNKEAIQFLPFVLCAVGLVAVVAVLVRPQRATLLALRITMLFTAAGGLLGMFIHLIHNLEFVQEIQPNAEAADLIIKTLKGVNPLVAPGILTFAAIIALIATYYHPVLGKRASS